MGNDDKKTVDVSTESVENASDSTTEVTSDQVQQTAVEDAKQDASKDLQQALQAQDQKKQEEFAAQQKVLAEQQAKEKQEKEAQLKKEIEEANQSVAGGPNGVKRFFGFLLLALFIAAAIFLPQISEFINAKIAEKNAQNITTGRLTCTLEKDTENLNVVNEATFNFINSEIIKLTYTVTYTGDAHEDRDELATRRAECDELRDISSKLDGITTNCSLNNGISMQKQVFDYEVLDAEKASAAYAEAGGIYPDFKKGDNVGTVESKLSQSGYKCERNS